MANAKGFMGQIRMDTKETTFGVTPSSPVAKTMPVTTAKLVGKQTLDPDNTLRGDRNPAMPSRGIIDPGGQIVVPVDQVGFGWWLRLLCGAPTTTGASPTYTHVFKPGSSAPSATIEQAYTDIGVYELFNGCKIDKLSIQWGGTGAVQATIDIMGATHVVGAATFDSPDAIVPVKFFQSEATVKEAGSLSAKILGGTIDISAGLDGDTHGNNGTRQDILEGIMQVSGTITAFFSDSTLLAKSVAGTESSLEFIWTKGVNSLTILVPEVTFERTSPGLEGPAGVRLQLNYRAYYENNSDAAAFKATLVTTEASYA